MLGILDRVKSLLFLPVKKEEDVAASKPLPEAGKERALNYLRRGYRPTQGIPEKTGVYDHVLELEVDDITTTNPEPWIPFMEKPSPWLQNMALSLGIQLTLQKDGEQTGNGCLIGGNVAGTKQYYYVAVTSNAALRHLNVETGQLQPTPHFVRDASTKLPEDVVALYGTHFAKAVQLGSECLEEQTVDSATASGQGGSTASSSKQNGHPAALGPRETPLCFLSPVTNVPEDWLEVVKNGSHDLLHYTVHNPIWKLLPDGDAKERLREYISKLGEAAEKEERAPFISQTELSFYSLPPKEHQNSAKLKLVYSDEGIAARSESSVKGISIRASTRKGEREKARVKARVKAIDFSYEDLKGSGDVKGRSDTSTSSSTNIRLNRGDRISHVAGSFSKGYLSHVKFIIERLNSRNWVTTHEGGESTGEVYDYAVPGGSAVVGVRLFEYKTILRRDTRIARLDLILRSFAEAPRPAEATYDVLIYSTPENEIATFIAEELKSWSASVLKGMIDPESPTLLLVSENTSAPLAQVKRFARTSSHSKGGPYLTEADTELAINGVGVFIPVLTKELCLERSVADQRAIFLSTRLFDAIETSVVPIMEAGVPTAEVENNQYLKKLLRSGSLFHQKAGANVQDFGSSVAATVLDLLGFGDHVTRERMQGPGKTVSGTPTSSSDVPTTISSSLDLEKDPTDSQVATSAEALLADSPNPSPRSALEWYSSNEIDAGVTPVAVAGTEESVDVSGQQPELEETQSPLEEESTRKEDPDEIVPKEAEGVPLDLGFQGLDRLLVVDFGSLSELPYSSTSKNALLRRKCLFFQKPYAYLRVPIQLPKPLASHTLIVRMRTPYLSQTGQIAIGLESPLGKRHESLQLDIPHKGQVSLVIDDWGIFPFPGVFWEPNTYLFLVLVVDIQAKRVSLYKPSLEGAGACGQVMLDNIPPKFEEGIEMVLRSGSTGKTTVKFAALLGSALSEEGVLAVRDSPGIWSMLKDDDKAPDARFA